MGEVTVVGAGRSGRCEDRGGWGILGGGWGGASWEERGARGGASWEERVDEVRKVRVPETLLCFEAEVRVLGSRQVSAAFATQARSERHGPATGRRQRGRLSPGVPPPLPSGLAPVSVGSGAPQGAGQGAGAPAVRAAGD